MKNLKAFSLLLLYVSFLLGAESSLTFNFTTGSYYGRYAPRHCIAVWVTDENGDYVKSLQLNGRVPYYRIMLAHWVKASDWDSTDAVTSASIRNHTSHTVTWDLTDINGQRVPNGSYKLWVEQTEDNSMQPGSVPLAELDLEISDQSYAETFEDVVFKSRKSIYDMDMELYIDGSPIIYKEKQVSKATSFIVQKNSIQLKGFSGKEFSAQILNARGQELFKGTSKNGAFPIELLPQGVYYIKATINSESIIQSFRK